MTLALSPRKLTSAPLSSFLLLQVVHAMDRTARVTDYRFIKEANGALTITNVMLEDDGKWQCEAENTRRYTENARPVKLVVLGEYPSLTHSPPSTFHLPLPTWVGQSRLGQQLRQILKGSCRAICQISRGRGQVGAGKCSLLWPRHHWQQKASSKLR